MRFTTDEVKGIPPNLKEKKEVIREEATKEVEKPKGGDIMKIELSRNKAIVLGLLFLLGVTFFGYKQFYLTSSSFNVSNDQIAKDLLGKSVVLGQGQLWGFNPDQNIQVKTISKKLLDDNNVVIIVNITSTAKLDANPTVKEDKVQSSTSPIPSKEPKKEPIEKEALPKKATLNGLVKLIYENVENNWYLVQIEGISLNVVLD